MKRYRQQIIPAIISPPGFKHKPVAELRKYVLDHYNTCVRGKTVKNQSSGWEIRFSGAGLRKITKGSALYPNKAITVLVIDKLLEAAEFNNFGQPKPSDPKELAGYLNFKVKCRIDGVVYPRIAVLLYRKDGKIFWNHEVSIKKG